MDQNRIPRRDLTGLGVPLCALVIVHLLETQRDQRTKGHASTLSALAPGGPEVQVDKKETRYAITDKPCCVTMLLFRHPFIRSRDVTKGKKTLGEAMHALGPQGREIQTEQ